VQRGQVRVGDGVDEGQIGRGRRQVRFVRRGAGDTRSDEGRVGSLDGLHHLAGRAAEVDVAELGVAHLAR